MKTQIGKSKSGFKVNAHAPARRLGKAPERETVKVDVFVPNRRAGAETYSILGYPFILKSDNPQIFVGISKSHVSIEFYHQPDLLDDLESYYKRKEGREFAFPFQTIQKALSKKFNRTVFSSVLIHFASTVRGIPSPSLNLVSGTGDKYFEVELYPRLTKKVMERSSNWRAVVIDPEFIRELTDVILTDELKALIALVHENEK